MGVAKTLSATTIAPFSCAMPATAATSITSSVGFDMVSKKTSFVSSRTASRHWSRSVPSTKVTSTPKRGSSVSTI